MKSKRRLVTNFMFSSNFLHFYLFIVLILFVELTVQETSTANTNNNINNYIYNKTVLKRLVDGFGHIDTNEYSTTTSNIYETVDDLLNASLLLNNETINSTFNDTNEYTPLTASDIVVKVFISILYSLIIVATLIGNTLVILAVVIVRKLHSRDNANNFLIVNLAISDFLVGVLAMPFAFYVEMSHHHKWNLGPVLCDLWTLSDVLLCTASILNLCAISVDRYFIILHAMVYTQRRNAKLMLLMILIVWVTSGVISIPPLFGWARPSSRLKADNLCTVSSDLKYQLYATFLAFYLPLIVMIVIYINIYRAAKKLKQKELETVGCYQMQAKENEARLKNLERLHRQATRNSNSSKFKLKNVFKKRENKDSSPSAHFMDPNSTKSNDRDLVGNNLKPRSSLLNDYEHSELNAQFPRKSISDNSSNQSKAQLVSSSHENFSTNKENSSQLNVHHSNTIQTALNNSNSSSRRSSFGRKFGRRFTHVLTNLKRRPSSNTTHGKNQKATRTLGIIMGCFTLCWLPFFLLAVVKSIPISKEQKVEDVIPKWLDSFLLWLGYFNSALNPMIYALFNREFRRPFVEILCFRCRGINEKLRDEERRKMYADTVGYFKYSNNNLNHMNTRLSLTNAYKRISINAGNTKNIIEEMELSNDEYEPNKHKTENENDTGNANANIYSNEPIFIQSETQPFIDINTHMQSVEKKKNKFFYGDDKLFESVLVTKHKNDDDNETKSILDKSGNDVLRENSLTNIVGCSKLDKHYLDDYDIEIDDISFSDKILDQSSMLKKLEYIKASTESILYQPDISTQNESSFLKQLEAPLSQLNEDLSLTTTSADVSGMDLFLRNTSSAMDSYHSTEPNKLGEENPCEKSINSVMSFSNMKQQNANNPYTNSEDNELSIYSKKSSLSSYLTNNTSNNLNQSIISKSSDQEENLLETSEDQNNAFNSFIKNDSFNSFKNAPITSTNAVNRNECDDQLLDCIRNSNDSNNNSMNSNDNPIKKNENLDDSNLIFNGSFHSPQTSKQQNLLNQTSNSNDFNNNLPNNLASVVPQSQSSSKGETSNQKIPLAYCTYNKRSNSSLNNSGSNSNQLVMNKNQNKSVSNSEILYNSTKSEKSNDIKSGTSV